MSVSKQRSRRRRSQQRGTRRSVVPQQGFGASGRHTPAVPSVRVRPAWHRPLGVVMLGVGLVVFTLHHAARIGMDTIPGVHNMLWFIGSLGVLGLGGWYTGIFDRTR